MKRITAKDRMHSWSDLLKRSKLKTCCLALNEIETPSSDVTDPFDCSDLKTYPTPEVLKAQLLDYVQEWKDLDSRVIQEDPLPRKRPRNDNNESLVESSAQDTTLSERKTTSHNNHRLLPDFFDFESQKGPPDIHSDGSIRKQVLSLENPSLTIDYEKELWNIFNKVPLIQELEMDTPTSCPNLLKLNQEMEQGSLEYSRLDAHALSRLRKRDRHHFPRFSLPVDDGKESTLHHYNIVGAVIRIEAWRRHTRRGQGTDENRCEMEFRSDQTLLDVHNCIVEMGEDVLFEKGKRIFMSEIPMSAPASGYFFIEDTFYTATSHVDYVTPVKKWLDTDLHNGKKTRTVKSRRRWLGIPHDIELNQMLMADMKLEDLSLRLAVRYVHIFNGDCETSIFFTDVGMRTAHENIESHEYPIIHDIFTNSTSSKIHGQALCKGCDHLPGEVVTIEDELSDGGPTLFCSLCYKKLHYKGDGEELRYNNFKVIPLSVLQNLKALSVGHSAVDCPFTVHK